MKPLLFFVLFFTGLYLVSCVSPSCVSDIECISVTLFPHTSAQVRVYEEKQCAKISAANDTTTYLSGLERRYPLWRFEIPQYKHSISSASFFFRYWSSTNDTTFFFAPNLEDFSWNGDEEFCWSNAEKTFGDNIIWRPEFYEDYREGKVEVTNHAQVLFQNGIHNFQLAAQTASMKSKIAFTIPRLSIEIFATMIHPGENSTQYQTGFQENIENWYFSNTWKVSEESPFGGKAFFFQGSIHNFGVEDSTLYSPWMLVMEPNTELQFDQFIRGAPNQFGGYLEVRTNDETWKDAGSLFYTGGYNGEFLQGKAWTVDSAQGAVSIKSIAQLHSFIGKAIQFRFSVKSSGTWNKEGKWWIDNFEVKSLNKDAKRFTCSPNCINGDCSEINTCICNKGWIGVDCSVSTCGDTIAVGNEECDSSIGCSSSCNCLTPLFIPSAGNKCSISSGVTVTQITSTSLTQVNINKVNSYSVVYVIAYGGAGAGTSRTGGAGGAAFGLLNTTNINSIQVRVGSGGSGTSPGTGVSSGGAGKQEQYGSGGGGGGSTGVFLSINENPILVAGGGGGAGTGAIGGAGGGIVGESSPSESLTYGGFGGTQVTGLGGCKYLWGCGGNGEGPFGNGGSGGGYLTECGSGGGGAGFFGGGGGFGADRGYCGGGGGGSSWINNTLFSNGILRGGNAESPYPEMSTTVGSGRAGPGSNGSVWILQSCVSGWTGSTCDTFMCSSCINGNCTGPNTCECSPGWTGTGCNISTCGDTIAVGNEECDSSIGCSSSCKCIAPFFSANSSKSCSISNSVAVTQITSTVTTLIELTTKRFNIGVGVYVIAYGGAGAGTSKTGGAGGAAFGLLNTTNINSIQVRVGSGGSGTSPGTGVSSGGAGKPSNYGNGAGGGGSTGVYLSINENPILVAGGGGGAGTGAIGGAGGGIVGESSPSESLTYGGFGGTQTEGLGGCKYLWGCGGNGEGPFGSGGSGGAYYNLCGSGGGGAGFFGGGGGFGADPGYCGGGGGGSSWINNTLFSNGILRGGNAESPYPEMSTTVGSGRAGPGSNGAVWILFSCKLGYYGANCSSLCGDGIVAGSETCDGSIGCTSSCECLQPLFEPSVSGCIPSQSSLLLNFTFTGEKVNFTFSNVKRQHGIYVIAYGGGGGGVSGGAGGAAFAFINASNINYISLFVGGSGGLPSGGIGATNGGSGGGGTFVGGGGGGSSGIWIPEVSENPVLIAGGGGGAGGTSITSSGGFGGAAGMLAQDGGWSKDPQPGGYGGSQLSPGIGGCGSGEGTEGCGANGTLGNGGNGGSGSESGGGGGGAGYFGGGGGKRDIPGGNGGAGGGGGGSSWITNSSTVVIHRGFQGGNSTTPSILSGTAGAPNAHGAIGIAFVPIFVTTGEVTTSPITSSDLTTSPITSAPLTTSPLTTSPITTADLTTSPITTSPITTADLSTSEVTTAPLTTSPLTTSPITTAYLTTSIDLSTSPITTAPLSTSILTTSPVPSSIASTGSSATSALIINISTGEINVELTTSSEESKSNNRAVGAATGTTLGVTALGIAAGIAFFFMRKRRKLGKDANLEQELKQLPDLSRTQSAMITPMLNDIEIKEKLGGGNFGEVYLGMWNSAPVAAKKLKDPSNQAEFKKELDTLTKLGANPHVVQFLGLFVDDQGEEYMIFEYCKKGSLLDFLRGQTQLPLETLLDMCLGVCSGMSFLDSKKIVHRDLSARNCLVSETDGRYVVKVTDFGMSRSLETEYYKPSSNTVPIRWTAPEAIKKSHYTSASDVWSFGIVCWEIFSYASNPYDWLSNKEVVENIMRGERLPKPENCPEEFWTIILSCWNINPQERPKFSDLTKQIQGIIKTVQIEPELPREFTNARSIYENGDEETIYNM